MNFKTKLILGTYVIFILLILGLILYITFRKTETIYYTDTNIVTRVEEKIKKDTIIKWYEKVKWKQAIPERVLVQTADSIYIEKIKKLDLMFKIDKRKDKITIYAFGNDSLIKQFDYEGIYSDFAITSQPGSIYVKAARFEINPLYIYGGIDSWLKERSEIKIGFRSGLKYKRIELSPFIEYRNKSKVRAGVVMEYKVF